MRQGETPGQSDRRMLWLRLAGPTPIHDAVVRMGKEIKGGERKTTPENLKNAAFANLSVERELEGTTSPVRQRFLSRHLDYLNSSGPFHRKLKNKTEGYLVKPLNIFKQAGYYGLSNDGSITGQALTG